MTRVKQPVSTLHQAIKRAHGDRQGALGMACQLCGPVACQHVLLAGTSAARPWADGQYRACRCSVLSAGRRHV